MKDVAAIVGGLSGTTDEQKLDLAKAMLSRMTAIPRPSSTLLGRRAPENIVSNVRQAGITTGPVDLSHYRTPTGEINLLTLAQLSTADATKLLCRCKP